MDSGFRRNVHASAGTLDYENKAGRTLFRGNDDKAIFRGTDISFLYSVKNLPHKGWTTWAEHCRPYQAAISIGILGNEVAMNEKSSSLLFFLGDNSDAGERVTVSYGCTKTDGESLEPPAEEMRCQHSHQERRT